MRSTHAALVPCLIFLRASAATASAKEQGRASKPKLGLLFTSLPEGDDACAVLDRLVDGDEDPFYSVEEALADAKALHCEGVHQSEDFEDKMRASFALFDKDEDGGIDQAEDDSWDAQVLPENTEALMECLQRLLDACDGAKPTRRRVEEISVDEVKNTMPAGKHYPVEKLKEMSEKEQCRYRMKMVKEENYCNGRTADWLMMTGITTNWLNHCSETNTFMHELPSWKETYGKDTGNGHIEDETRCWKEPKFVLENNADLEKECMIGSRCKGFDPLHGVCPDHMYCGHGGRCFYDTDAAGTWRNVLRVVGSVVVVTIVAVGAALLAKVAAIAALTAYLKKTAAYGVLRAISDYGFSLAVSTTMNNIVFAGVVGGGIAGGIVAGIASGATVGAVQESFAKHIVENDYCAGLLAED